MVEIEVVVMHAFCDGGQGGNPAGVVLAADALSPTQKQQVARTMGLSETAFVSQATGAALRLEFFTPTRQIAHCGHATVAALALCHQRQRLADGVHRFQSVEDVHPVQLHGGQVTLVQPWPSFIALAEGSIHATQALAAVGAEASALGTGMRPVVARGHNGFLLLPMRDAEALAALRPDDDAIAAVCEALDLVGFYPYATPGSQAGRAATARMFGPRFGIHEESATGTAAGPLGAWLSTQAAQAEPLGGAEPCRIEQGHWMAPPSPSLLSVRRGAVAGAQEAQLLVSGVAVQVRTALLAA